MRILALITDAFRGYGGIALYNRDVLTALCQHPEITEVVAVPRSIPNVKESLPAKLEYVDISARGKFFYLYALLRLLVRQNRFDVILCSHINLMPVAWLLKKMFQVPVILEIYGIDAWSPPVGRKITRMALGAADEVICISSYTRKLFFAWSSLSERICTLLPNAIHLDQYGEGEKSQRLIARYGLADRRVLLTLGRLVSRERAKGFDEILELLPALIQDEPDICYVIAGEGDYRSELEAKAKSLKVENHVVFTGMVNEEEKADLYRLADVYVMPSRGEGFGFVFLEAMACGIPVIASIADGSCDAVRDGKLGILVDPDDSEGIRQAILKSLKLPRGIPTGLEYFSFSSFTRKLHAIIDKVTEGAGQRL
ncbi:MAG: glycosyltransferase family 1 protein [Desulfobulbus sp.]|nr:MAG: glycosyltransferase family 1 protein [Desulfobulbus sp.]